ncbi:endocuticle structural glycoprotein SgAbd-2-like [Chrysoperla carnea]|uniref:endocuticle structural glycoprotein SgAbd-2-like n=1 Tax=Chrysoperla carnea TaxID=189513 RepID=UPI001D085AD1|nr:endocuticle structural glycoprotein SgAbd-2-like [Chrysoperla carnea]
MKVVIVLVSLFVIVLSKPQRGFQQYSNLRDVPILKYSNDFNPADGSYSYNYETGNGIQAQEQGYLKNRGNPQTEAQVMQGSYSYTGPDGVLYTITYIADENGFRAEGAHIPTPPPIPEAIARSLYGNTPSPSRFGRK